MSFPSGRIAVNDLFKVSNILLNNILQEFVYVQNRNKVNKGLFDVSILSIDDTIQFMKVRPNSIVRFGDGEFMLMNGKSLHNYQTYDADLGRQLLSIFNSNIEKLLVCAPEPLVGVKKYKHRSRVYWTNHLIHEYPLYKAILGKKIYGNSFVSRPYMIYKNKELCKGWFDGIKSIFKNKDIILVEGVYSRSGVGNDLFSGAERVRRILCPSINAYDSYDKILDEVCKIDKKSLIIVAIGPAGKVLTADLVARGYWVLDLGHIDSEYEWFLSQASKKVKIANKHTADTKDYGLATCEDPKYLNSIIKIIE